jgi:polyphosphate kinase 2 (PPK2 family)
VQDKRFKERIENPAKRWKFSPMDLKSRDLWEDYSKAKDEMFAATDNRESPWWVVEADDKKRARLNCISHMLNLIPYQEVVREILVIPPRPEARGYTRPPISIQHFVPELY